MPSMSVTENKILVLRKELGLTQSELADQVGVSQTKISRLESDLDGSVDLRLLSKIARALNRPVSELLPEELAEDLQRTAQDVFYAFCPNPLCRSNAIKRERGDATVYWNSDKQYAQDRFDETNFCPKCGEELVKECPSCKRRRDAQHTLFCITCGQRMYDRPRPDEWEQIERALPAENRPPDDDIPF